MKRWGCSVLGAGCGGDAGVLEAWWDAGEMSKAWGNRTTGWSSRGFCMQFAYVMPALPISNLLNYTFQILFYFSFNYCFYQDFKYLHLRLIT